LAIRPDLPLIERNVFAHVCRMGLEGLVSKHRDSAYRGGRFDRWIKLKNRQHAEFSRVMDAFSCR
jgi:bifunctional non-homologous end joining protein LigD